MQSDSQGKVFHVFNGFQMNGKIGQHVEWLCVTKLISNPNIPSNINRISSHSIEFKNKLFIPKVKISI